MKLCRSFLVLVLLAFGFAVQAADATSAMASSMTGGVAVLDLQRAIMLTDRAKEKIKTLESQKDYSEMQKKAESIRADLMKKQETLQKDGSTWSAEKRTEHVKSMEFMRKDFELAAQKLQSDNQELMRQMMQESEAKVKGVLEQLIKDKHLSLVLDKNAALYADQTVDLTLELVDRLNKVK